MSTRRARNRRRGLMRGIGALLLLILVAGFGYGAWHLAGEARSWAAGSELFRLKHWQVEGCLRADQATLTRCLDPMIGQSLFDLDPEALRRTLEADPWVREAQVILDWPNAVAVRLVESRPLALYGHGASAQILCESGCLLPATGTGLQSLPRVTGGPDMDLLLLAERLREMKTGHGELFDRLQKLDWGQTCSLWLEHTECRVRLDRTAWDHSMALLEVAARRCPQEWLRHRELDLTFTNQLIWRHPRV